MARPSHDMHGLVHNIYVTITIKVVIIIYHSMGRRRHTLHACICIIIIKFYDHDNNDIDFLPILENLKL